MQTMIQLRGMTWDHPRGVLPLQAAADAFRQSRPDVEITWDARSLHDFEAYPLEKLAEMYDLIMIDHPHLGTAVKYGALLPLDEYLPADELRDQEDNSVGQSCQSYIWQDHLWALPVDAAAQVSAYRADLLQGAGLSVPKTWEEVRRTISEFPAKGQVAMPLVSVHAFASFVTLSAQLGGGTFWSDGTELPLETGESALALLEELVPSLHPLSLHSDPIGISDHMASSDDIAYVPLIYGYSNYARAGFARHLIRYSDIPSDTGVPSGSMIGGVGLAVSSRCQHREAALAFARMTASGEFQRGLYFESGGQPGHRSAWTCERVNAGANGFFRDTLRTLDHGFVRPRFDGYIAFQEQAGARIREHLMKSGDRRSLVRELNERLLRLAEQA